MMIGNLIAALELKNPYIEKYGCYFNQLSREQKKTEARRQKSESVKKTIF